MSPAAEAAKVETCCDACVAADVARFAAGNEADARNSGTEATPCRLSKFEEGALVGPLNGTH
jgi:hypothetical protein